MKKSIYESMKQSFSSSVFLKDFLKIYLIADKSVQILLDNLHTRIEEMSVPDYHSYALAISDLIDDLCIYHKQNIIRDSKDKYSHNVQISLDDKDKYIKELESCGEDWFDTTVTSTVVIGIDMYKDILEYMISNEFDYSSYRYDKYPEFIEE